MSNNISQQVQFISGDETYLTQKTIQALKHHHQSAHLVQFSDQFAITDLQDCLTMTALFSTTQLILVKNPWFFSKTPTDDELNRIKTIVNNVPTTPHTLVIYALSAVDQRKKVAAFLKKNATTTINHSFKEWEQNKILDWLEKEIKHRKKSIDKPALIALEQIGGTQLQLLSNELDTLCLYIGNRDTITVNDIKAMSAHKSTSTFQLIESLKANDTARIIANSTQLLNSNEDPIRLMGLIISQIRLFVHLLELDSLSHNASAIAKAIGKNPYYIQRLLPDIKKNHTLQSAQHQLIRLADADFYIKSGQRSPKIALEMALIND